MMVEYGFFNCLIYKMLYGFLILTFKNDTKLGINQAENESRVIIKRKLKKYKLWKSPYFQAFF